MPLATIPEGEYGQEFVCDTEFFKTMENSDVISSDVKVKLDITHKNGNYNCRFKFSGTIEIPCDRCLDALSHEVDTEYCITVRYGEEYNDESDEVLIIPHEEMTLDVSGILHDTIVLTIPIRNIHAPGKCNREMEEKLMGHAAHIDDEDDLEENDDRD